MSIYEYDEELHFKTLLEECREQGLEEGERRINKLQLYPYRPWQD